MMVIYRILTLLLITITRFNNFSKLLYLEGKITIFYYSSLRLDIYNL